MTNCANKKINTAFGPFRPHSSNYIISLYTYCISQQTESKLTD
jgi:hypothetical protein